MNGIDVVFQAAEELFHLLPIIAYFKNIQIRQWPFLGHIFYFPYEANKVAADYAAHPLLIDDL